MRHENIGNPLLRPPKRVDTCRRARSYPPTCKRRIGLGLLILAEYRIDPEKILYYESGPRLCQGATHQRVGVFIREPRTAEGEDSAHLSRGHDSSGGDLVRFIRGSAALCRRCY